MEITSQATATTRRLRPQSMSTSRPAQVRATCGFRDTGMALGRGIPGAKGTGHRPVTAAHTGAQGIVITIHGVGGTAEMTITTGDAGPTATITGPVGADIAGKGASANLRSAVGLCRD